MSDKPSKKDRSNSVSDGPSPQDITRDHVKESRADELAGVIDEYARHLRDGNPPKRSEIIQANPHLANELDECLAGLEFIHTIEPEDSILTKQLGDFQLVREIGRGGMGAVYEAKQISLGRTVALKVLRFGGVSDREAVDRFRREAETVANLHHTNIVPIFSFGRDDGVNYYAMQLIDGSSLDRVAHQSREPIGVKKVADWGLQAAEALSHAHQRDVIHRDVKPSNLILDDDGRIWLSDFGLAKRIDDVTLSITGALLGTPRYMSPEQATTTIKSIDHRSDIYSLGATLYELVTGQPVFASDTPHGIINQILTSEPVRPRLHRADIPRDLETILLKCLSKDVSLRYATASELAEDLRAIVEDRPIRARRPPLVDRAKRWVRKRKKMVVTAGLAALATVACISLILGGQTLLRKSRQVSLQLNAKSPGLVAQVADRSSSFVQALPTQEPLIVEAGKLSLQVAGEGQLSQQFQIELSPGEQESVQVSLGDRRIGRKLPIDRSFRFVPFSNGVDPILLDADRIRRWDAETDTAVWSLEMGQQDGPLLPRARKISWPWRVHRSGYTTGDKFDHQPYVLGHSNAERFAGRQAKENKSRSPIDFDNDGEVDVLVASRESAWLLAISGRTGEVLWITDREQDSESVRPVRQNQRTIKRAVIHEPIGAGDLNGDKSDDVIAMFGELAAENDGGTAQVANVWIEAISGRTGESLWRSDIQPKWLEAPAIGPVPYESRWFFGLLAGSSSKSWGANQESEQAGLRWRTKHREYCRKGMSCVIPGAPHVIDVMELEANDAVASNVNRRLACIVGSRVITFDLASGQIDGSPIDTRMWTGLPGRYADMNGDGNTDIVFSQDVQPTTNNSKSKVAKQKPQVRVAVWSIANRKWLWKKDFNAHWPRSVEQHVPSPNWPLVQDVNNDGACEVLLPIDTTCLVNPMPTLKAPWGEIAAVAGATGEVLWSHRIFTLDQQIDHFAVGPDIDGDGSREVFVASLWGTNYELFVDAISGANGNSIWQQSYSPQPLQKMQTELRIGNLGWWNGGGVGGQQLTVRLHPHRDSNSSPSVVFFSAADGSVGSVAGGAVAVWPADVNRDGVEELCSFCPPKESVRQRGELSIYQGVAREYERRLHEQRIPVCDLDGDGVRDMLEAIGRDHLRATSTVSGETLWKEGLATDLRRFHIIGQEDDVVARRSSLEHQQNHDFDHDGTPDLLIGLDSTRSEAFSPIHAVSGRTGKTLWQAQVSVTQNHGFPMVVRGDFDGKGHSDVAFVGAMNLSSGNSNGPDLQAPNELRLWLVVLSGQDGSVKWKKPLTASGIRFRADVLELKSPTVDLNGDGVLDFVLPRESNSEQLPMDPSVEMVAISGSDGATLWQYALSHDQLSHAVPATIVSDLDGDAMVDVVVIDFEDLDDKRRRADLVALAGATGREVWRYKRDVDPSYGKFPSDRPRPIAITTKSGRSHVAFVVRSSELASPFELDVLDYNGNSLNRIPLSSIPGVSGDTQSVFVHDVDGDGLDEVLFWNRGALVAHRADSAEVVWRCPIPTRFDAHLEGLIVGNENTIAVLRQGSGDNSLIGVDVASGEILWSCVGPTPRRGNGWVVPDRVEYMGMPNNSAPLALFEFMSQSVCRQASYVDREFESQSYASVTPETTIQRSTAVDPRRLRNLPWRIHLGPYGRQRATTTGRLLAIYCVTLVLIPCASLFLIVRRRCLDASAIVGLLGGFMSISIGWWLGNQVGGSSVSGNPWLLALAPIPLVVFLFHVTMKLVRKKWRKVMGWTAGTAITSAAIAIFVLWHYATTPALSLQPGEQYSTSGWYLICLWGMYAMGTCILIGAVFRWCLSLRSPKSPAVI